MELDDLKAVWKMRESGTASVHELEFSLRKNSRSVTNRVRRNVWIEIVTYILFAGLAFIGWKQFTEPYQRVMCVLTWMLSFIFLLYLSGLLRSIAQYENAPLSVKDSLTRTIEILEKFVRTYFQLTVVALIVAFIVGILAGVFTVNSSSIARGFQWTKAGSAYIAWFVLWSAAMLYFSRWYIRRMYGTHIQQLKQLLADMENG